MLPISADAIMYGIIMRMGETYIASLDHLVDKRKDYIRVRVDYLKKLANRLAIGMCLLLKATLYVRISWVLHGPLWTYINCFWDNRLSGKRQGDKDTKGGDAKRVTVTDQVNYLGSVRKYRGSGDQHEHEILPTLTISVLL